MFEIVLSVMAFVLILGLARLGMNFGAFYEIASTLFLFLAMMVALRYWYSVTRLLAPWFNGQNGYAAFGAFWIAFLLGTVPLIVLMSRVSYASTPRYPRVVDAVFGLVFGAASAAILVCTVMTSLSVVVPKVWPEYDRQKLIVPFDMAPIVVYQSIEQRLLGISPTDPGHTRFPTFEKSDADNLYKYWR
jgi:uncharacterized membrane protein required for colicin V production